MSVSDDSSGTWPLVPESEPTDSRSEGVNEDHLRMRAAAEAWQWRKRAKAEKHLRKQYEQKVNPCSLSIAPDWNDEFLQARGCLGVLFCDSCASVK